MLVVPITQLGGLGGGAGAPAFDVSSPPGVAGEQAAEMSPVNDVALGANPTPPTPATSVRARSRTANETSSPESTEPEATTTGPGSTTSTSLATAVPSSTAPPPSTPLPSITITLPLKLSPVLKSLGTARSERGQASWFHAPDGTCAHQTLPLGTLVKVTRVYNGAVTTCRVNDRGPYVTGRVIDLSFDAFEELAHPDSGVIEVVIEW